MQERGEKEVPACYYKHVIILKKELFHKCHQLSSAWPEWGHRALLPAKKAGEVGNRIVMSGLDQSWPIIWGQAQNWDSLIKEGGVPKFIFSFLLHTKPVLWSTWSLLSGSQIWHAHLHLCSLYLEHFSSTSLYLPNPIHPLWLCSYPIYSMTHGVHNDFFLEWTLLFIHVFIHSSIFSIYLHVVPMVSTTQLNI